MNIDVDGTSHVIPNLGGQNFTVKSNSVMTNNTSTKTFTVYKQAPFVVGNITTGSSTPQSVAGGGTYNFQNNITDVNYVVITP